MAFSVSYDNLVKLIKKIIEEGYRGIIFGSFALPYYAKSRNNAEIDMERATGDIDVLVEEEYERRLLENVGQGIGITAEGSYFQRLDEMDGFIEFFPKGVLGSIDPKYSPKLEEYLFDESNTEEFNGVRFPKPWLWLALKLAAYRKGKNPKHISDIIYLRGIMPNEFEGLLEEIENHGLTELVELYRNSIKN
jgi:predicted nucleotidyltransferase